MNVLCILIRLVTMKQAQLLHKLMNGVMYGEKFRSWFLLLLVLNVLDLTNARYALLLITKCHSTIINRKVEAARIFYPQV